MKLFFVFDVESIGLHGEGFAVAGGVYLENGAAQWEFSFCCPSEMAQGFEMDRKWVARNVPILEVTHRDCCAMRLSFWQQWEKAKAEGAQMAAECLWPVEARFIRDCVYDDAGHVARDLLNIAPMEAHRLFHLDEWPDEFCLDYINLRADANDRAAALRDRVEHFINTNGAE